jgi:hypothetical protein
LREEEGKMIRRDWRESEDDRKEGRQEAIEEKLEEDDRIEEGKWGFEKNGLGGSLRRWLEGRRE